MNNKLLQKNPFLKTQRKHVNQTTAIYLVLGFLPARNSYLFAEAETLYKEMKVYCNLLATVFAKFFGLYILILFTCVRTSPPKTFLIDNDNNLESRTTALPKSNS